MSRTRRRSSRRVSLLWQLFATNAAVLIVAAVVLVAAPVSISHNPHLTEVLAVAAGLAAMLAADFVLLRRTLTPLLQLAEVMGSIDLRRPGRRLAEPVGASAEPVMLARAFNAMLDRLEHERRQSTRLTLAAQEEERARIAREMHDQIGQTLTAVTIQAEAAAQMDPIDRTVLEQIARTALQSLEDVRRIGRELRPEALDDLGLGNALITLCRRMGEQSTVRLTHDLAPTPGLSPEAELVVYRIAQEAITNALRHADAAQILLDLALDDGTVRLLVRDDGRGLPGVPPDDTAGIAGMRERALLIGADLHFACPPGGGTEVHLTIPAEEADP